MGDKFSARDATRADLVLYRAVSATREILAADPEVDLHSAARAACAPYGLQAHRVAHVASLAMAAIHGCKIGCEKRVDTDDKCEYINAMASWP